MKHILTFAMVLSKALRLIMLLMVFIIALGFALHYFKFDARHPFIKRVHHAEMQIVAPVKTYLPTRISGGKDVSGIITVGFLILFLYLNSLFYIRTKIMRHVLMSKTKRVEEQEKSEEMLQKAPKVTEKQKIKEEARNRKDLLNDLFSIKKQLKDTGRFLAFLSIDVVNSTDMKIGEDNLDIEYSFDQYMEFVTKKFRQNGVISEAWTPDGVMACFNDVEQALHAAKAVLQGLPKFNKSVNLIQKEFHVRCGINAGQVYYDPSTPLERYSDRVIDIAGHMQKKANSDSIYMPRELVKPVEFDEPLNEIEEVVDGLEVLEWKEKQ